MKITITSPDEYGDIKIIIDVTGDYIQEKCSPDPVFKNIADSQSFEILREAAHNALGIKENGP